jgi:ABC-type branched-subunit amino acid transport system substrate-binding protein
VIRQAANPQNSAARIDTIMTICPALVLCASLAVTGLAPAQPQARTIRIAGFGALSGHVQSFGINSRAAQQAAVDEINARGGVRLADARGPGSCSPTMTTGAIRPRR